MNTIFIQIASYRDPQLLPTIEDCINKAKYPDNLRFGICWQHSRDDKWDTLDSYINDNRFKIIDVNYRNSRGVCWARNSVQNLYQNETYTLQLDSHHRFVQDWDETLIDMLLSLQQKDFPKPLITSYVPSFDPSNDPEARVLKPWKMNFDRFIPEGAVFFLPAAFNPNIDNIDEPLMGRFYSGHFAFSLGSFCLEVKHDPEYYFHGEEINISARAFTHGYDIFHPHKIICWHEYTRKGRTKQWDDDKVWSDRNKKSHARNRKLFGIDEEINDIDFGRYGFGTIRTLKDYEKYAGIEFSSRSITQDVIDHKPPKLSNMQLSDTEFKQKLCRIFKHCIDIAYRLVPETDYDFWVVVFKDKDGNDIYRQDANSEEIKRLKNDKDSYCKIWRSFKTTKKPLSWIVWPHSINKGWCDPIIGHLP